MAVGKKRLTEKHLPRRMYRKHGAYWFVDRANKWHRLGDDYSEALKAYAAHHAGGNLSTIALLIAKYEAEVLPKRAEETRASRKQEFKKVRQVFGDMRPIDLTAADAWQFWQERGETQQARHEIRALSAVMGWAVKWGAIAVNPLLNIGFPTFKPRDRYVSDLEFVSVRELALPIIRCAMDIALMTAMRQKDILALERRNITEDGITIAASKTGKRQHFPMTPELREAVDTALRIPPQVRQFVIANRKGKPYTRDGFQSQWQRLQRKALKAGAIGSRFTFHDLRAKSLSDTKTLEEARARAGHADARITASVYRRLPETATVLDITHLRKKP